MMKILSHVVTHSGTWWYLVLASRQVYPCKNSILVNSLHIGYDELPSIKRGLGSRGLLFPTGPTLVCEIVTKLPVLKKFLGRLSCNIESFHCFVIKIRINLEKTDHIGE